MRKGSPHVYIKKKKKQMRVSDQPEQLRGVVRSLAVRKIFRSFGIIVASFKREKRKFVEFANSEDLPHLDRHCLPPQYIL